MYLVQLWNQKFKGKFADREEEKNFVKPHLLLFYTFMKDYQSRLQGKDYSPLKRVFSNDLNLGIFFGDTSLCSRTTLVVQISNTGYVNITIKLVVKFLADCGEWRAHIT